MSYAKRKQAAQTLHILSASLAYWFAVATHLPHWLVPGPSKIVQPGAELIARKLRIGGEQAVHVVHTTFDAKLGCVDVSCQYPPDKPSQYGEVARMNRPLGLYTRGIDADIATFRSMTGNLKGASAKSKDATRK